MLKRIFTYSIGKEFIPLTLIIVGLSLLSYYFNDANQTILFQSDEIWSKRLTTRLEVYPFSIRVFTSYSMLALMYVFGTSEVQSFIVVQYTLVVALGYAFHLYLKAVGFSLNLSLLGVGVLFLSYPIFGAHFQPTYTWDDMWQYLALTISLTLGLKRKWLASCVVFAIGIVAREVIFLFLPTLIYLFSVIEGSLFKKRALALAIPVILFCFYALFMIDINTSYKGIHFGVNFENPLIARDTFFSLMLSFGALWYASAQFVFASSRVSLNQVQGFIVNGFWFTVPLTVLIVMTMAYARETRTLFPPFVFIIPMSLWLLRDIYEKVGKRVTLYLIFSGVALGAFLVPAGMRLSKSLFPEFAFRVGREFHQDYFGVHLAVAVLIVLAFGVSRLKFITRLSARV